MNGDRVLIDLKDLIRKGIIKSQGIGSGTNYILSHSVNDISQISLFDNSLKKNNFSENKVQYQQYKSIPNKINQQVETKNILEPKFK